MVAFSKLVFGLSAIAVSLAAPTELSEPVLEKRGPMNFDYTTGGEVSFSPGTNEFSVTWDTTDDFVVGVGWNPGSTLSITHTGTFNISSGLGNLNVYGWTENPLIEYYVMESNEGIGGAGSEKGTVTSDGGTYTIWENTRTNEPSILGTSTFNQYLSVRNSGTSSGTVTVENHFTAWASHGMTLGTMNFQVIAVESWDGSGSASQSISNTGTGSTGTGTTTTTASGTTTTSTSTGCSALWVQCGGEDWTGPKCCSSGSCTYSNAWYSQCLT